MITETILGVYIEPATYPTMLLHVAIESSLGRFQVFTGVFTTISEYSVQCAINRGNMIREEHANYLFPKVAGSHKYDSKKPVRPEPTDCLSSLSDLYEQAKDIINTAELVSPKCEELHGVLRKIRDLAAPAIVHRDRVASGQFV